MTKQWQPPKSASAIQSPTSTARYGNAVSPGTVAARIQFLHGLEAPAPASGPGAASSRPRQDFRTHHGRHVNSRSGKYALPSDSSHIRSPPNTSYSFLGLSTPRTNHENINEIAQKPARLYRTPGLSGQLAPRGQVERTQNDAASPWRVLLQPTTPTCTDHLFNIPHKGVLEKFEQPSNKTPTTVPISDYSSHVVGDVGIPAVQSRTSCSTSTTSRTRRQSVRDLFREHGIEIPRGLICSGGEETSDDSLRQVTDSPPTKACKTCHRLRSHSGSSVECWKCRHRLCSTCDRLPGPPAIKNRFDYDPVVRVSKKNLHPDKWPSKHRVSHKSRITLKSTLRPEPTPLQSQSKMDANLGRCHSGSEARCPDCSSRQATVARRESRKQWRQLIASREGPDLPPVSDHQRLNQSSEPLPYFVTGQSTNKNRLRGSTGGSKVRRQSSRSEYSAQESHCEHRTDSSSASNGFCKSPTCRATHCGHRPYRHSISCTKRTRTRKHRVLEVSDDRRAADSSLSEDAKPPTINSYVDEASSRHSLRTEPDAVATSHPSSKTRSPQHEISPHLEYPGYAGGHEQKAPISGTHCERQPWLSTPYSTEVYVSEKHPVGHEYPTRQKECSGGYDLFSTPIWTDDTKRRWTAVAAGPLARHDTAAIPPNAYSSSTRHPTPLSLPKVSIFNGFSQSWERPTLANRLPGSQNNSSVKRTNEPPPLPESPEVKHGNATTGVSPSTGPMNNLPADATQPAGSPKGEGNSVRCDELPSIPDLPPSITSRDSEAVQNATSPSSSRKNSIKSHERFSLLQDDLTNYPKDIRTSKSKTILASKMIDGAPFSRSTTIHDYGRSSSVQTLRSLKYTIQAKKVKSAGAGSDKNKRNWLFETGYTVEGSGLLNNSHDGNTSLSRSSKTVEQHAISEDDIVGDEKTKQRRDLGDDEMTSEAKSTSSKRVQKLTQKSSDNESVRSKSPALNKLIDSLRECTLSDELVINTDIPLFNKRDRGPEQRDQRSGDYETSTCTILQNDDMSLINCPNLALKAPDSVASWPAEDEVHDCEWKSRCLEAGIQAGDNVSKGEGDETGGGFGLTGVTILIHLKDRQDLVIKTDAWLGGEAKK